MSSNELTIVLSNRGNFCSVGGG